MMFCKYYTCELITLNGEQLKTPSIVVSVFRWWSPVKVGKSIKNQLEKDGLKDHRMINLRRIY
jgi:hypothetical protein